MLPSPSMLHDVIVVQSELFHPVHERIFVQIVFPHCDALARHSEISYLLFRIVEGHIFASVAIDNYLLAVILPLFMEVDLHGGGLNVNVACSVCKCRYLPVGKALISQHEVIRRVLTVKLNANAIDNHANCISTTDCIVNLLHDSSSLPARA